MSKSQLSAYVQTTAQMIFKYGETRSAELVEQIVSRIVRIPQVVMSGLQQLEVLRRLEIFSMLEKAALVPDYRYLARTLEERILSLVGSKPACAI